MLEVAAAQETAELPIPAVRAVRAAAVLVQAQEPLVREPQTLVVAVVEGVSIALEQELAVLALLFYPYQPRFTLAQQPDCPQ
jgi:hypothetical protein